MKTTNILFVCRSNCFRSKIAEAYFKKLNKNNKIKVKSAGIIPGYKQSENQIKINKEFGLNIRGKPKGVNKKLLIWTDLLVNTANDVPEKIFDYGKNKKIVNVISWKIKDVKSSKDDKDIKRAIKQIIKKTNKLYKRLNHKNDGPPH